MYHMYSIFVHGSFDVLHLISTTLWQSTVKSGIFCAMSTADKQAKGKQRTEPNSYCKETGKSQFRKNEASGAVEHKVFTSYLEEITEVSTNNTVSTSSVSLLFHFLLYWTLNDVVLLRL